jgi:hypothetical protein
LEAVAEDLLEHRRCCARRVGRSPIVNNNDAVVGEKPADGA